MAVLLNELYYSQRLYHYIQLIFSTSLLTIIIITLISDRNMELQFVFNNVSHIEPHCGVICFAKFEPIMAKKLLQTLAMSCSPDSVL